MTDATPANSPVPELDPVIHAHARLRVVSALSTLDDEDRITFPSLRKTLGMSAGNLSTHLRKLEDAEYIEVTKTHQARFPTTLIRLSRRGRLALEQYIATMRQLLDPVGSGSLDRTKESQ